MHWKMLWEIVVFILAGAALPFYWQTHCERILRREFDHEFFHSVVNANEPVDYPHFRMQLICDFLALPYLLKNAGNTKRRFSIDERLLRMYFRVVFSLLWFKHRMGLSEKAAVLKLTSILEYFANRAPRESWKAEIDVMVEDNGTVFMVYPLSDVASEWLDTNMFRNTQRLGDIQFVEPGHLDDLVKAMLDSGLSVVWAPYSLTLTNIQGKARESLSRDSLPK